MIVRALVLVLIAPLAALGAEPRQSHANLPSDLPAESTESFMARMLQAHTSRLLQDLAAGKVSPQKADRLAKQLESLARRFPIVQDLLKNAATGDRDTIQRLTAGQREIMTKLQKEAGRIAERSSTAEPPGANDQRDEADLVRQREQWNDFMRDYLKIDDQLGLQNSPALQRLAQELAKGNSADSPLTFGNVSHLVDSARSIARRLKASAPGWLPAMPNMRMPSPDFVNNISLGLPGGTGSFEVSNYVMPILTALAVVVAAAYLFHNARVSRRATRQPIQPNIQLLDPDLVTTRDDMIRAFENMAMHYFGDEASHWHHRRVATRLAEATQDQPDAETLATLYEQARYAPAPAALDWSLARGALRRLAEVRA